MITGGLHGNEPAGVEAASRLFRSLGSKADVLRGKVVALSGNRPALALGSRFVSRDLNRGWRWADLERLTARSVEHLEAEDLEQRELHDAILSLEREGAPLAFLDLHTTSGPTRPFVCLHDTVESRRVASALPVNVVLGLEHTLHGTLLGWVSARGHVGVSFEGGQHVDPLAPRRHLAAAWMFLVACGALDPDEVPDEREHLAVLGHRAEGTCVVEVRHRHVVEEGDDFEMLGDFVGFDPVEAGQVVARDRHGLIRTPEAGIMLMPRYQDQGEDGFFVAREVARQP